MKKPTAKERLLEALINTPSGLTNKDLIKISPSFTARLSEIYGDGHIIEKISLNDGVNLYRYKGKKENDLKDAYSMLAHVLYKKGHKEVAENLAEILEEANVKLHRKSIKVETD